MPVALPRVRAATRWVYYTRNSCFGLPITLVVLQQNFGNFAPYFRVPCRRVQGIFFFGYGVEESTAYHYLQQAYVSARRIKALNPTTNITVVCNPGVTPDRDGVFDMVRDASARRFPGG